MVAMGVVAMGGCYGCSQRILISGCYGVVAMGWLLWVMQRIPILDPRSYEHACMGSLPDTIAYDVTVRLRVTSTVFAP